MVCCVEYTSDQTVCHTSNSVRCTVYSKIQCLNQNSLAEGAVTQLCTVEIQIHSIRINQ